MNGLNIRREQFDGDNATTQFTLTKVIYNNSQRPFIGGDILYKGVGYTVGVNLKDINLATPLLVGQTLVVFYVEVAP